MQDEFKLVHAYKLPNISVYVAVVNNAMTTYEHMRACCKARYKLIGRGMMAPNQYMICLLIFADGVLPIICKFEFQPDLQISITEVISKIQPTVQNSVSYINGKARLNYHPSEITEEEIASLRYKRHPKIITVSQ